MSIAKLSQLPMELPPSAPDPRGWSVFGNDEVLVGTVIDMLIRQETNEVVYLVVQLTDGLDIALPLGLVSILEAEGRVLANSLTADMLRCLPALPPEPLDDGREQQIYVTFLPHHTLDYDRPEFRWGGARSLKVAPLPPKPYANRFTPTPQGRQSNRSRFG